MVFTLGSAVAVLFSIAAAQILLGLSIAGLLIIRARPRLPPIVLPLGLFIIGTLLAWVISPDLRRGLPQVRKLYVFLTLPVVYMVLRDLGILRRLAIGWFVSGIAISGIALLQFQQKYAAAQAAGEDFYSSYVGRRITGFMSHWMTFGGEMMVILLVLIAYVLFAPRERNRWMRWVWLASLVPMFACFLLGLTRGIWIGAAAGGIYLLWSWKRWTVALLPVAFAIAMIAAPPAVRSRVVSIVRPTERDSNAHRVVTWRTGVEMIKANPVFGVGLEQVPVRFHEYIPLDIPRPLPEGWYEHLHNIYLQYAAERGIPFLLVFLWLVGTILRDFHKALRKGTPGLSNRRFLLHAGIAVIIATLTAGMFEHNLGDSEVLQLFLTIVACGYIAAESNESSRDPRNEAAKA